MGFRFKIRNIEKRHKKEFDKDFLKSLSPRAKTICEKYDFYNINYLKKFIESGKDFNQLRNCGSKTYDELHNALKIFSNKRKTENKEVKVFKEDIKLITKNIFDQKVKKQILLDLSQPLIATLSTSAINSMCWLCNTNKPNIEKFIIKSILGEFDFNSIIKNVGKKTVEELEYLTKRIIILVNDLNNKQSSEEDLPDSHDIKSKIQNIFDHNYNKQVLFLLTEPFIETLSVRARNSICWMCNISKPNIEKFIIKSIIDEFDFNRIRNVGKKTIDELEYLKSCIVDLINDINNKNYTAEDLFIMRIEKITGIDINDNILKDQLNSNSVNIIYFFEKYILHSRIFNDIEKDIIISDLSKEKSLDFKKDNIKIGEKHNLSYERVRQIRIKLLKNIYEKLKNINSIIRYSFNLNHLIENNNYLKIEIQPNPLFLKLSYLKYNTSILARILSFFISDKYYTISSYDVLKGKLTPFDRDFYYQYRQVKITYLISNSFIKKVDLLNYFTKFYFKRLQKTKEDYFEKKILNDISSTNKFDFTCRLICENFNSEYIKNKGFLIKRNTLKKLNEYVREVLIDKDKPLYIEEIFNEIEKKHPGRCKSISALRGTVGKECIYFRGSGKSKYGLKEWEKTKNIKSGTIKNLCIELLKSKNEPLHPLELFRFIKKHRDTTQRNIITNLKADPHNNFIFFEGGYIGLKNERYNESKIRNYKYISAGQATKLCNFMKNHIFYDKESLLEKFSKEFDLEKIQIEQIIENKINEDVLKLKSKKVYYDSFEHDSLIHKLFKNENSFKYLGFNPYRISLKEYKVLIKVKIVNTNNFTIEETDLDFDQWDREFSEKQVIYFYNKVEKLSKVFIWNKVIPKEIIKTNYILSTEDNYSINRNESGTVIINFNEENQYKFISILKILLRSNLQIQKLAFDDKEVDLNSFDIKNKTKLEAYAHIIEKSSKIYDLELTLTDAKRIFERKLTQENY